MSVVSTNRFAPRVAHAVRLRLSGRSQSIRAGRVGPQDFVAEGTSGPFAANDANAPLHLTPFSKAGALPDVVLTVIDADVIKTYVELGMGVGIVAAIAYDAKRDSELVALDSQHLFEGSTTRVGLRKGAFMRAYAYRFIEMFAPQLSESDMAGQLREAA